MNPIYEGVVVYKKECRFCEEVFYDFESDSLMLCPHCYKDQNDLDPHHLGDAYEFKLKLDYKTGEIEIIKS